MMRNRETPVVPWREFSWFIWFVVYDVDGQAFTKRFHNFYEGTLWRDDYETDIRYVFCERDILFDVPYIRDTVNKSHVERQKYHFIPKARHGACFFGKRRNDTLRCIGDMLGGILPPTTPCGANVSSDSVPIVYDPIPGLC